MVMIFPSNFYKKGDTIFVSYLRRGHISKMFGPTHVTQMAFKTL